jgi:hypothetical protein
MGCKAVYLINMIMFEFFWIDQIEKELKKTEIQSNNKHDIVREV